MRSRALLGALATTTVAIGALAAPIPRARAATVGPFAGCERDAAATPVVGRVACRVVAAPALGAPTAFSYYVPPRCEPGATPRRRCATLYLLHGFGGSYTSMLGTAAAPSSWVRSLTAGPAVDPSSVDDPWTLADTSRWKAERPLDLVLVAPHGRTVAGGYGPSADLDSYWADWNPRYARGGDRARYDTPPPRFETFLLRELVPYVERTFPVGTGRAWRALAGTSLGGFGAYKNGLQHPDAFAAIGSVSGAHNFLFAPGLDPPTTASAVGVQPPAPLPAIAPPAPTGLLPQSLLATPLGTFLVALEAFGDPVVDQAAFRGNMPRDLAMNARAVDARGAQVLTIRGFVNDTVPRRAEDAADPVAVVFEDIVLPMNLDMEAAFGAEGVEDEFAVHPGLHSEPYRAPWIRGLLETYAAHVGRGAPAPPVRFDFRSTSPRFDVWGWRFAVDRPVTEFLTLRAVSCRGLTLQGTGRVTVDVPPSCPVRRHHVVVDLGPSAPVDEPAGVGAAPAWGRTVTVPLGTA